MKHGARVRRNRGLRTVAWAMVVAGLALLGWFGWQLWGTSWVAEQRHREIIVGTRDTWRNGGGGVEVREGPVSAIVRVPRFGDDYAVPILDGTEDEVLAAGFGRFTSGAEPGGRGNFAIAGHRVTHGEPLRGMPDLRAGDDLVVETAEATYTYRLDTSGDALTVSFRDSWVLDRRPRNPVDGGAEPADHPRLLTVTTCAELFHTDDRLVAFGHLVSVAPR